MVKCNVVWTKTADIQFVGVLEYWVNRNKSNTYPKKLIKLVSQKTTLISELPFLGKLANFKNFRMVALDNFSIYYIVTDNQIIISAFWDNRQDPKKLLKILQEKV